MFKRRTDKATKQRKLEEIVLPTAKLKFCADQLQNLNYIFQKKLLSRTSILGTDKSLWLARSVTERLIQRMVCCAGILDPRFSSKFLISNGHHLSSGPPSTDLEYIVRLDCLSTPQIYTGDATPKFAVIENDADYPPGYARVRLQSSSLKIWSDCANPAGYLRRDKVQARLVELLAQAASSDSPSSPLNVDESIYCGTPGKIVDSHTLYQILQLPPEEHVFYGPGGNVPRFPDPRDFRLAIVDEPSGIRLKIEFLSPALSNISIDVRILVAIGVDAWPSSTDFPTRIALGHTDCFLYHQAAQMGMFLVGFGVQSSAWQIRLPAAQDVILNHYGANSTIRTILDILFEALKDIDGNRLKKQPVSYKILNRYMFLTMLLKRLEEASITPSSDLIEWSPTFLSTHVLAILDKLIDHLNHQHLPNYFFKKSNLLVNPGHLSEDDYVIEGNNIKSYILRLFDESLMSTKGIQDYDKIFASQESENVLLHKWKDLIDNLLPPPGTRGRRFCFVGARTQDVAHTEYTGRQLEYIGLLLDNLLKVKQKIITNDSFMSEEVIKVDNHLPENHLEDVIYLLVAIMDQARDKYLTSATNPAILKNRSKIRVQFNSCTSKLVDFIRKDRDTQNLVFHDDLTLVKTILKWLYKAMDQNKRCLGPILRPYLNNLFSTSHSISWHLDFIKQRLNRDELHALGAFARLVNDAKITPAEGLIDAVNKNWGWAKDMLKMVEKNTLRVVFVQDRGKVYRHILSLPSYQRDKVQEKKGAKVRRQNTLPSDRNYFSTILSRGSSEDSDNIPKHEILKNASPLTLAFGKFNRRGEHRGYGDILNSLQTMQKLNMFQQATSSLPQEARQEVLEVIHSLQSMKQKRPSKKWSNTLPASANHTRVYPQKCEKYTPKEESAGVKIIDGVKSEEKKIVGTLIGSCRAARIREDSSVFLFQDSFKIKSLLNKSESFKF